jgi:hypothetical protein
VQASELGSCSFVGGKPIHGECKAKKAAEEAAAVKVEAVPEDACQFCKKSITNRSETLIVAGKDWHRACFAECNGN